MTIHENASDLLRQYRDVLCGHSSSSSSAGSRVSTLTVHYDTRRP